MPQREFNLAHLVEQVAIDCANEANTKDHSLNGYMDPELASMYFGDVDAIYRRLKDVASNVVQSELTLDILISARRPPESADDTVSNVQVEFAVESSTPRGADVRPHCVFRVDLLASRNQPPVPLYVNPSEPLPIFYLASESIHNRSIHSILRHWGLRCDGATSIPEAILDISRQATLEQAYRVILVSEIYDDGTVLEFAAEIRASSLSRQTRLVYIARCNDDESREVVLNSGFDAYLAKPFHSHQLLELLVELIGSEMVPRSSRAAPEVLIVEDNVTNQKIAMLQLRRLGISPDVAQNGKEALEALSIKQYDLVLLDYQMPIMDGYETLVRIRREPAFHDLPVVILSCLNDTETITKCRDAGMSEFVSKPIPPQRMEQIVNRWCRLYGRSYFRFSA